MPGGVQGGKPQEVWRTAQTWAIAQVGRREQGGCQQQDGHGHVGLGGGDRLGDRAQL